MGICDGFKAAATRENISGFCRIPQASTLTVQCPGLFRGKLYLGMSLSSAVYIISVWRKPTNCKTVVSDKNKRELSWCQLCRDWWHRRLSRGQPPALLDTTKWHHDNSRLSVLVFHKTVQHLKVRMVVRGVGWPRRPVVQEWAAYGLCWLDPRRPSPRRNRHYQDHWKDKIR